LYEDKLNAPEFLELVKTLMGARDGKVPPQKEANDTAARIAHYMTITDVHGNVVRNVTAISLSDFIAAANSGGSLARLIADATNSVPNLAEALRAERGVPMSPPPPAPPSHATTSASTRSGSDAQAAEAVDGPVTKLQSRAAAALDELRAVEAACEELLDTTHHRHPTVRQLLASCQSTVSTFERCSSSAGSGGGCATPAGIKVTGQEVTYSAVHAQEARRQNPYVPTNYAYEETAPASSRSLETSFSPAGSSAAPSTPSLSAPASSSPAFSIGNQVCCTYRRSDGSQGVRDVKVVAFVGSGTYAVEYEIDTVASLVSRPGDVEGGERSSSSSSSSASSSSRSPVYLKGSKVLYRGGSTAEVLRVGDDETRDELGRPSYVLKVTTYTDGANLSLPT